MDKERLKHKRQQFFINEIKKEKRTTWKKRRLKGNK